MQQSDVIILISTVVHNINYIEKSYQRIAGLYHFLCDPRTREDTLIHIRRSWQSYEVMVTAGVRPPYHVATNYVSQLMARVICRHRTLLLTMME